MEQNRIDAMNWWNGLSLLEKCLQMIENEDFTEGYSYRLPKDLTGREIEMIYNNQKK